MLNWLKSVWCRLTGRVPVVVTESAESEHTELDWCNVDTSVETLPAYSLDRVIIEGNTLRCAGYVWTLPAWRVPYVRDGLQTLRRTGQVSIPNDLMVLQCDLSDANVERVTIREMLCMMDGVSVDGCSVYRVSPV